jgi:3-methyladenine DNA glycosylase AlkD
MSAATELIEELRTLGSAQAAKTYRRHGARGEVFGVSYAHLGKLTKRIKKDHALAQALWQSGIYDARILATMIADPAEMSEAELERWIDDLDCYALSSALAGLAARKPGLQARVERWIEREDEWPAYAGWVAMALLAQKDESLPDGYFQAVLDRIERDIHHSQNRVRYGMNEAVIAIGTRNRALEAAAKAAAGRIGKVLVDHGDTDCKTPDAAGYIDKVWTRRSA